MPRPRDGPARAPGGAAPARYPRTRLIDLHAHVLPGLDDGPAEIEGSLELLRAAAADGTRTIAATPHLRHDFPSVDVHELRDRCEELRARMPPDIQIEVLSGAEVDIVWAQ